MNALIDPNDQIDPIAAQFIPNAAENYIAEEELADPIGDEASPPPPASCIVIRIGFCSNFLRIVPSIAVFVSAVNTSAIRKSHWTKTTRQCVCLYRQASRNLGGDTAPAAIRFCYHLVA